MIAVIGLGAGGHAKVVVDILTLMGGFDIRGLLDPRQDAATEGIGLTVLGDDSLLPALVAQGVRSAFLGIGGANGSDRRRAVYDAARRYGIEFVSAIHPSAIVARSVVIGAGPTLMAGAILNPGARLGDNVIVNTGAIVDHDCVLGDHVHIAVGACLAGGVRVEEGAHVGIGATVLQGVTIGAGSMVGAGAVVLHDVPPATVVVGVPAKALRHL